MIARPSGTVVLMSDFGSADPYVGLMKGMVLRAHPNAQVIDLLHDVPAQDVALAAFFLAAAVDRFPPGTVFLAVVDPGVGTERRALCALAHDCYWVGPDNGVLGEVITADGFATDRVAVAAAGEIRVADFEHLGLRPRSRTFHGRDVFAPFAGGLAGGRFGFTSVGPRAKDVTRLPPLVAGAPRVVHVDAFGNLVTNVPAVAIANVRALRIAGRSVPLRGTYGDGEPGELLCLVNSYDLVEVAENGGSAAAALGVGRGATIELEA